jgi:CRISPR-associated protein Csx10
MENSLTKNQVPNDSEAKDNSFVLPSPFKIRLEMKSDWHIGTGAGRPGSVDKLIARDVDGFPFVPAKTLNGIWRDAMETLTLGLDGGNEGKWSKWVEAIFGIQPNQLQGVQPNETQADELQRRVKTNDVTYSFSLLSLHPARLSQNLRGKIDKATNKTSGEAQKQQQRKLLSTLTFIKPGVSIDEKTGTAITDFLRFEEMGRVSTVLEAECNLNFDKVGSESQRIISALLLLSAKLVERIGGKRRRGAGLCELKIIGCEVSQTAEAIKFLQEKEKEETSQPINASDQHTESTDSDQRLIVSEESKSADANSEIEDQQTNGWQTLEFTLRLHTPVSIVTATLGNVSESLDYIPGTYLLPHITKVLRKKLGSKVFQAVAYGDLQVLPATVEVNKERGLPVPRALAQHKTEGGFEKQGTLYNKFAPNEIETDKQLKPFRSGYLQSLDSIIEIKNNIGKLPSYKNTPKTLLMHNTVEDKVQRPTENVGGVYSREAIAAGTVLRGEIRLKKSLAAELDAGSNWWNDLNGYIRLGTSRKDDYGLAELELKKDDEKNTTAPKTFEPKSKTVSNNNKRLTVYLLSDCLLRNVNLRQTNLVDELIKKLGKKLGVALNRSESNDKETTSLVMTRRIESWHEGWGFPRPTLIAMEAGSCVVFQSDKDLDLDALIKLEAEGIGERRGEGYGQVRFNPSLLTQAINGWEAAAKADETKPPTDSATNELSDEEKTFAMLVEEAAWREELKIAVLKVADDLDNRKQIFGFDSDERTPPMSQVGGLRSAISRLKSRDDVAIVTGWLDHLKATDNRRKKWADKEKAEDKIDRIKELITEDDKVWLILCKTKIEGRNVWTSPPTIVRSEDGLQEKLWADAVRALFGACARAHKRELEKKEDN